MKKLLKISAVTAVLMMASSGAALAHGTETNVQEKPTEARQQTVKARSEVASEKVAEAQQLREEKKAAGAETKQATQDRKAERRQNLCQSRKQGIENKFSRIVTNSERIQTKIDGILEKALKYEQDNNLEIANFEELDAAAQQAKLESSASIEQLKTVKPSVDCNNVSVSSDIQTFKAAAATVRDDLKSYKQAAKDILKALIEAKQAANQTEGGEQ